MKSSLGASKEEDEQVLNQRNFTLLTFMKGFTLTKGSPAKKVAQLCPTLCDCTMPGFPIHYQLLELAQTYIGDGIQPYHPLSSPSPPALNLSQHQGLFQGVSSSHQVGQSIGVSTSASVLPMNIQD